MVLPPLNKRQTFRQFADRLAEDTTQGRYRLNPQDPDADLKFGAFIDQKATEVEAQTGQPKEATFRSIFDKTVGRAAGAVGRGALGAGRAIQGGAETAAAPIAQQVSDISSQLRGIDSQDPRLNDRQREVARSAEGIGRLLNAADQASAASGGVATETLVAPIAGQRGLGQAQRIQIDPRGVITPGGGITGIGASQPNQFDQFVADLEARRREATIRELLTLGPQRGAFREDENINPLIKAGIEAVSDVTNFVPGGAIVNRLRNADRAADAVRAQRTAGQIGTRGLPSIRANHAREFQRAAEKAAINRKQVTPFGPNRTTEGVPGGIPAGAADDVPVSSADDALEAEVRAARLEREVQAARVPTIAPATKEAAPNPAVAFESELEKARSAPSTTGAVKTSDGTVDHVGEMLEDGSVVMPQSYPTLFGVRAPEIGITRGDAIANSIRKVVPASIARKPIIRKYLRTFSDPVIDNAFEVRTQMLEAAQSRGAAISGRLGPEYRKLFNPADNGRIEWLAGIDPAIPGAPTLSDVAARLPNYQSSLTPEQIDYLRRLDAELKPLANLLKELGDDFGQRTDIMDGGFYIPRGSTITGDAPNLPPNVGGRRPGSKPGFESAARYDSQARGIQNGDEYPRFEESLAGFVERAGRRSADQFTQNYLSTVRDVDGTKFGKTIKELLLEENPRVLARMEALRSARDKLAAASSNRLERQITALDQLLHDPSFDDLESVRNLFSKVRVTGKGLDTSAVENRAILGLRETETGIRQSRRRGLRSQTTSRGPRKGMDVNALRDPLRDVKREIQAFNTVYEQAKVSAKRRMGTIGRTDEFPQLNGKFFPERMSARATQLIEQEAERFPNALQVINESQMIFKAMQATLDNSGVGIQGLLGGYSNPRAFSHAMKANVKALGTDAAYGDWATGFNTRTAQQGRLTVEQWTDFGLAQIRGIDTDVTSSVAERIPVAGRGFRAANRMFTTVSNVIRPEMADDLLIEELAKGKTLQQVIDDGSARRIASFVNDATGYSTGDFSLANLLTFSARFLTARIKTLSRAVRGVDIDIATDALPVIGPKISKRLPKVNPVARLEDRLARRAVIRMFAFGTMFTVAVNEMLGEETDFRPIVGGKANPNFIRIRALNRDWSVFGPWDSTVQMLANFGTGNFKRGTRSLASAPLVSLGWDLAENKDYFGRPIIRRETDDFGNPIKDENGNPIDVTNIQRGQDILARLAESTVPFSAQDAPEIISQIAESGRDGHLDEIGANIAYGVAEGLGVKSSPLSNAEIRALLEDPNLDPRMRKLLEQELAERKAGYKTGAAQRILGTKAEASSSGGGGLFQRYKNSGSSSSSSDSGGLFDRYKR